MENCRVSSSKCINLFIPDHPQIITKCVVLHAKEKSKKRQKGNNNNKANSNRREGAHLWSSTWESEERISGGGGQLRLHSKPQTTWDEILKTVLLSLLSTILTLLTNCME